MHPVVEAARTGIALHRAQGTQQQHDGLRLPGTSLRGARKGRGLGYGHEAAVYAAFRPASGARGTALTPR